MPSSLDLENELRQSLFSFGCVRSKSEVQTSTFSNPFGYCKCVFCTDYLFHKARLVQLFEGIKVLDDS